MIIAYRTVRREFLDEKYTTNLLCVGGDKDEMFDNGIKDLLKQSDFEFNPEIQAWESANIYDIHNFIDSLKIHKRYDDVRFLMNLVEEAIFQSWSFLRIDDTSYVIGKMRRFKQELERLGFTFEKYPIPHWFASTITNDRIALENLPESLERHFVDVINDTESKPLIKINGSLVYLLHFEVRLIKEIANRLRYFDKRAYQDPKYKEGDWDGYVDIFDYQSNSVPIGYLYKVEHVLNEYDVEYEIEDNRREPEKIELNWHGYELREYQREIVDEAKRQESAFVVAPTGSGKTVMAMRLIYELGYSAFIVTNKVDLLWQWHDDLEQTLGVEVGVIGNEEFYERDITVCTVQTAINSKPLRNYDIFIVDEAHRLPAETFYELSKHIDSYHRFGFSATPERSDGAEKRFLAMTGSIIELYSARDLIDMGYLAEPEFVNIDGWDGVVDHSDEMSWQEELSEACHDEETNERIIDKALSLHSQGHYVYIDVRRINHGHILKELIDEHENVVSEFIYGKHDKEIRQNVFQRFKEDRIILISTLIKEGVDLPEMSAIVLAGPAKSNVENIQKVGRALRPNQGLNKAIVVDRKDNGKFLRRWFRHRQKLFKQYYSY